MKNLLLAIIGLILSSVTIFGTADSVIANPVHFEPPAIGETFDLSVNSVVNVGCEPNCKQPTAVRRGQKVPVWEVLYCVIGKPGQYKHIDCQNPKAVHLTPTGNHGVCFIGSDGKPHWDYQWAVHEGRKFINHKIGGRWQPNWRDAHSRWQK